MLHDLLFLQFSLFLQLLDDARLLREIRVADHAIHQNRLMPGMGKRNTAPLAPGQDHLFGPSFFNGKRTGRTHKDNGKKKSDVSYCHCANLAKELSLGSYGTGLTFKLTLGEIDFFAAPAAMVRAIKFV